MTGFDETVPPDDVPAEADGTAATQATENDFDDRQPLPPADDDEEPPGPARTGSPSDRA